MNQHLRAQQFVSVGVTGQFPGRPAAPRNKILSLRDLQCDCVYSLKPIVVNPACKFQHYWKSLSRFESTLAMTRVSTIGKYFWPPVSKSTFPSSRPYWKLQASMMQSGECIEAVPGRIPM